jgi:hypothetical protein
MHAIEKRDQVALAAALLLAFGGAGFVGACPHDCGDDDAAVGVSDLLALLSQWSISGSCDFDGDGVGVYDLLALLAAWGPCPANGFMDTPAVELPIVVGAGWSATSDTPPAFFWIGDGMPFNNGGPFTYTSALPTAIAVTDDFCPGDQFRIWDNGVAIGDTSFVPGGDCAELGPDAAFASESYTSGCFIVDPGSHSVEIQVIVNPFGLGRGYIRVDTLDETICPAVGACFTVVSEVIECHPDGTTFTYTAEGVNTCTGSVQMLTFTGSAGAVGEDMCVTVTINDDEGGPCCTTELCVAVPDCPG